MMTLLEILRACDSLVNVDLVIPDPKVWRDERKQSAALFTDVLLSRNPFHGHATSER